MPNDPQEKDLYIKNIGKALRAFYAKFTNDSCFQMAASLSFSTIISLVPIITLSFSIITSLRFFSGIQGKMKDFLFRFFIPSQANVIQKYIEDFSRNLSSLNAVSIVSFLLTGIFLLITVENNLNRIWRVKKSGGFIKGIITYWAVLTLGPVLIGVSFHITNKAVFIAAGSTHPVIYPILSIISSYVINTAFIFIMYFAMPKFRVGVKSAMIGALFAGLFYEILKMFFSLYIHHINYYQIYGSIAILPIFLGWLYSVWLIFLIGAQISYFIHFPGQLLKNETDEGGLFSSELGVFLFIIDGYLKKEAVSQKSILKNFYFMEPARLDQILHHLVREKLVLFHEMRGYLPFHDPSRTSLSEALLKIVRLEKHYQLSQPHLELILERMKNLIEKGFPEDTASVLIEK